MSATLERPLDGPQTTPELVRLLDVEPDLGIGVDPEHLVDARRRTVARVVTVSAGPWDPEVLRTASVTGPFAALILSGLLVRECSLADRTTTQLIGPGDVIPLIAPDDSVPVAEHRCRAAMDTRIAVLDARFLAAAQRWPWLTARMMERTARWADRALLLQAISQLGRVDARIVALLWHLADRWGRVCQDGIVIPLKLTHAAVGTLVGAQRPTVSLALKDLRENGVVVPYGDAWLLHPDSRDLLAAPSAFGAGDGPAFDVVPAGSAGVDLDERLEDAREQMSQARRRAAAARRDAGEQRDRARFMRDSGQKD